MKKLKALLYYPPTTTNTRKESEGGVSFQGFARGRSEVGKGRGRSIKCVPPFLRPNRCGGVERFAGRSSIDGSWTAECLAQEPGTAVKQSAG